MSGNYNLGGRQAGGKAAYSVKAGDAALTGMNVTSITMREDTSFTQLLAEAGDECVKLSDPADVYPVGFILYLPTPAATIEVATGSAIAYEGF